MFKIIKVKRKTRLENRYSRKMGRLQTPVTRIYMTILGIINIYKLHEYRKTYHGNVKDTKECDLDNV